MEDIIGETLGDTSEVVLKRVLSEEYEMPITRVGFSTDPSDRYGTTGSVFDVEELEKIPKEFLELDCVGYRIVELDCIMYKKQLKLMLYVRLPVGIIVKNFIKNQTTNFIDWVHCL